MTRTYKEAYTVCARNLRITNSLEKHGIEYAFCRHLDKMTNIETVWGGHLKNATCHYTNRWEFSGKTYGIKELLKKEGFRWDRAKKVWWKKSDCTFSPSEIAAKILRYFAS